MKYDVIESYGMRRVKFLPPHFFVWKLPPNTTISWNYSEEFSKANPDFIEKGKYKNKIKNLIHFIDERLAGRYYINTEDKPDESAKEVIIGFEEEADLTMFTLLTSVDLNKVF